jgi:hypothetical protein
VVKKKFPFKNPNAIALTAAIIDISKNGYNYDYG